MIIYLIYFMYLYCIDSEQGKDKVNESQSISLVNTDVKYNIVKQISAMATMT